MRGRRTAPDISQETSPCGFDDYDLRLGDVMRGERATLGKSLLDVQRELKIKAAYIAAIENSDPGAFETPGFVAGYVRSYARYLGMDPEWAFKSFCAEADFSPTHGVAVAPPKRAETPREAASPADRDQLFTNARTPFLPKSQPMFSGIEPGALGSIAVLVALIGAIGYGGVAVFREVQKVQVAPVEQTPEVVTDIDPLASAFETADATTGDGAPQAPSAEALDRLYRPKALDVPVMTPRDGPIASLDPATVGTFSRVPEGPGLRTAATLGAAESGVPSALRSSIDSAVTAALTEAAEASGDAGAPVVSAAEDVAEVVLFAVQPSWIRVRAADGTVLFEKILDAHEEYVIPDTEGTPTLRAGNAGSLYFSVNGQTYGPAGEGPSVVKNVALSADSLSGDYALADPDADGDLADYYAVAEARQEDSEAPGDPADDRDD